MTGEVRWGRPARGQLARLVIAALVLTGLGLTVGWHCPEGMAPPMAVTGPMTPHTATGHDVMGCGAQASTGHENSHSPMHVCAESDTTTGSAGFHGVQGLMSCLMLIAAVIFAAARLLPAALRGIIGLLRLNLAEPVRHPAAPRTPSLMRLCPLRT